MNPKTDSEILMNAVIPLAEKMLKSYGEFYPYGGYVSLDGKIVDVGIKDQNTNHPKSADMVESLRSTFRKLAEEKKCKAVAIVFDVAVDLPHSSRKTDAIQVCLDHQDGYSAEVFFPYHIVNNEIVYEATFAQEGEHGIFQEE